MTTHPFRNLYVHIPFCRHKCGYCDFNAYAGMDRLMADYVVALNGFLSECPQTCPAPTGCPPGDGICAIDLIHGGGTCAE